MGSRGPIGDPKGRRALDRRRKMRLKLVESSPPAPPENKTRVTVRIPAYVAKNASARAFWKEHARTLEQFGRLRPEFRQLFGRVCILFARVRDLEEKILQEGVLLEGPRGGKYRHPLFTSLHRTERELITAAAGFGLDPRSESRLPFVERAKKSLREQLLG